MFGEKRKLREKVSSTLFDLTHLEINTIIKEEMDASKAAENPRLLLHMIAAKYSRKLINMGYKYDEYLGPPADNAVYLFRGTQEYLGSGYKSFKELSTRARDSRKLLENSKKRVPFPEEDVDADMMMLQRIETISDDIRSILAIEGVDPVKNTFDFDDKNTIGIFRTMPANEARKYELNLDLRQYLVIKKANDVGTERVVLQTIIGMDGDITTRILKAFADQPISFINDMHHEAIRISVDFWKTLVTVVVELGTYIIKVIMGKGK